MSMTVSWSTYASSDCFIRRLSTVVKCVTLYAEKEFHIHCSYVLFVLEDLHAAYSLKMFWF